MRSRSFSAQRYHVRSGSTVLITSTNTVGVLMPLIPVDTLSQP